jgi:O-antigen ligase
MKTLLVLLRARRTAASLVWQVLILFILSVAAGITLTQPLGSLFFLAILILSVSVYLAYNYPALTVILIITLSLIAENLKHIHPIFSPVVEMETFNLRLWDPLIFGIVITLFLKFFLDSNCLKQAFLRYYPLLAMLFILLVTQLFRTIGVYGINAAGELRTYYSYLLMVPYLTVFMKTPNQRFQMLKVLVLLSFSLILVALFRGLSGSEAVLNVRFISASGALAVLYGLIALFVMKNRGLWKASALWFVLTSIVAVVLIIFTGHRSVWLATVTALITLYFLREIKFTRLVQVGLIGLLAGMVAYFALFSVGHNPVEFIETRLLAFINPEQDPTAYWRYSLWIASLEGIRQNTWLGNGLGKHFQLIGPGGELITTSPHNLYVSIPFQIGIPGLLLYLGFIAVFFIQLVLLRRNQLLLVTDKVISSLGITILAASHAYYVAYTMELDWMTWAYAGLAASAVVNRDRGGSNGN